jgi:hypothetical protein
MCNGGKSGLRNDKPKKQPYPLNRFRKYLNYTIQWPIWVECSLKKIMTGNWVEGRKEERDEGGGEMGALSKIRN